MQPQPVSKGARGLALAGRSAPRPIPLLANSLVQGILQRYAPEELFDTRTPGGDAQLLQTVRVDELTERKNLVHQEAVDWPPLKDGPLEGSLTTQVSIDRAGKVRETKSIVSQNRGLVDVARRAILTMEFKPYLVNGVPVQVVTRVTMGFKTVRL